MSHRPFRLTAITATLWLCAAAAARADYLDWSYTWDRSAFAVPANGGAKAGVLSLELPALPAGGGPGASPVAPVVVLAGTTADGAADSPADLFQNAPYSVTLTVTDDQTQESHDFTFDGLLTGLMTKNLIQLANHFVGGDRQTATISGRQYTVTLGFSAPAAAAANFSGAIRADVLLTALPLIDPLPAAKTPEPAGLVLAALALPAIGLTARRRYGRRTAR
jgi:hypothetical protein